MARHPGPHDLLIEAADCEFYGACTCGQQLGGPIKPDESFDQFGVRWEHHVMTDHRDCDCDWHQL